MTSEAAIRERVCGTKRRYLTPGEARREVRRLRGHDVNVAHYKCPFCAQWHVGHPPSIETITAISRIIRGLSPDDPQPHALDRRARRRTKGRR